MITKIYALDEEKWLNMLVNLVIFFFNDTATTEIYTLSLHDALPISRWRRPELGSHPCRRGPLRRSARPETRGNRSEEHTSELQSQSNIVCRLLLEKKNAFIPTAPGTTLLSDGIAKPHPSTTSNPGNA